MNSAEWSSNEKELLGSQQEMGELQKHLTDGEYDIFKFAPVVEGNFVQVTKRGEVVNIHNHPTTVTVAIGATNLDHPIPNVLVLAMPEVMRQEPYAEEKRLTSLYPLQLVRMSVSDAAQRRIKLNLANGRVFYLQLNAPTDKEEELFEGWLKLIYKLMPQQDIDSKSKERKSAEEKKAAKAESKKGAEYLGKENETEKESPGSRKKRSHRLRRKPDSEKQGKKNSGSAEIKRRPKGESPDQKQRPPSRGKVKQTENVVGLIKKSFSNLTKYKANKTSLKTQMKTSEEESE